VLDTMEKQLGLSRAYMEPSRAGLYRFGNVSAVGGCGKRRAVRAVGDGAAAVQICVCVCNATTPQTHHPPIPPIP